MKIRVAQKCTGLVMPTYASAESQIIPLSLNVSPAVPKKKKKKEKTPKNDPEPSYEIDLAAACLPNVACKTSLILCAHLISQEQINAKKKVKKRNLKKVNNPIRWENTISVSPSHPTAA